jgi:two-component system NtrC family sensor kinase
MEDEIRQAQTQLVRVARLAAAGELAAGVAHQINNPLTTVIADAQLLLKTVGPDHPGYASASAIFQAGWRAQRVVQRLLNFSRPDEGQFVPTAINDTILEALDLVSAHLERGGVELRIHLGSDLPPVPANGHQLEEVWINLLMNARDALVETRPGVIIIASRLAQEERAVVVEVADNGRGIGEPERDRVFAPFFTTKDRGRGNGLGLSVCQSIVADHGGKISFHSQNGEGTTFWVRLPLTRPSPASRPQLR